MRFRSLRLKVIVLIAFFASLWLIPIAQVRAQGQVFVEPVIITPGANGVIRFAVGVEGVPTPGFSQYQIEVAFNSSNSTVTLENGQVVIQTIAPPMQLTCSAGLLNQAATVQDFGSILLLHSGQGNFVRASQGVGDILCAENGPSGNGVGIYSCGVGGQLGVVTPQTGSGHLIDFVCFAPSNLAPTVVTVIPRLVPGENGAIFLFSQGEPIIDSFASGQIVIGAVERTTPPTLAAPLRAGDTTVQGSSSEPDGTQIQVFVNSVAIATAGVLGGLWNVVLSTPLATGDRVAATATAAGKLESDFSDVVTVFGHQAPELTLIGNQVVVEGAMIDIPFAATYPNGTIVTFNTTGLPPFCTLMDHGDGTGEIKCTPSFADAGVYVLTLTVTDNNPSPLSDSETFALSVGNVNRAPELATIGSRTVAENTTLPIPLVAIDSDGDAVTFRTTGLPPFCTLTPSGSRTATLICTPGFSDAGIYTVTVTVMDVNTTPLTDDETFTLIVTNVNRLPVAMNDTATVLEDTPLTIAVLANDSDADGSLNATSVTVTTTPAHGTAVAHTNGTLQYTPVSNFHGTDTLSYTVRDNEGAVSNIAMVTITIQAVNDPPVLAITPVGPHAIGEGERLELFLSATDPDGDIVSFHASNLPSGASFEDQSDGTATFRWMPDFGSSANYGVLFTVTDNGKPMASDFEEVTITVGNVNRLPVLTAIGPQTIRTGGQLILTLLATDPDEDDTLIFSATNLPNFCSLTNHTAGTAQLLCTPNVGDAGIVNVRFTVTDDGIPPADDFEDVTITVGDGNRPPVLNPIGNPPVSSNGTEIAGTELRELQSPS